MKEANAMTAAEVREKVAELTEDMEQARDEIAALETVSIPESMIKNVVLPGAPDDYMSTPIFYYNTEELARWSNTMAMRKKQAWARYMKALKERAILVGNDAVMKDLGYTVTHIHVTDSQKPC
jgi:hypothetical protein